MLLLLVTYYRTLLGSSERPSINIFSKLYNESPVLILFAYLRDLKMESQRRTQTCLMTELVSIGLTIPTQSSRNPTSSQPLGGSTCDFSEDARSFEKKEVQTHFTNLRSVSITSCVAGNSGLRKGW